MLDANIYCPGCHKSISVPLGEIGPGKSKPCPNCGAIIKFAGADASKVQQVIDQFGAVGLMQGWPDHLAHRHERKRRALGY
jgi:uncharacterized paraquat-inducible protein A